MFRQAFVAFVISASLLAEPGIWAAEPTFKPIITPDSVRFASIFSEDKHVGAMIFDNLLIDTPVGRPTLPCADTKTFSHVLTIESEEDCEVEFQVRGYVSTTGTASAALLIQSGGFSKLVDLEQAIKEANGTSMKRDPQEEAQIEAAAKANQIDLTPPGRSDDFMVCISRRVPKGTGKLQTTLVLLVDRLDDEGDVSGALLAIDSIDFEIRPIKK